MKRLLLIVLSLSMCIGSMAQRTHSIELKIFGGRNMPHRAGMESLARTNMGGELNYYFSTRSGNFYDRKYRSPQQGFGINYNYLGYPNVLGSAISAYSFMDFAIADAKVFRLGLRLNAGLAYATEKYNKDTNPENLAISTNLCFYFNLGANFAFRLPYGLELKLMPMFVHYSNGAVIKPNLGLNQLAVSVLFSKDLATTNYVQKRHDYQDHLSPHEAWLMGTLSTADEYSVGYEGRGGGFLCSTVAAGYTYQYGKIGKVGASFDMFYNENMKYYYFDDDRGLVEFYSKFSDIVKFGVSIGHQLVYRRFEFMTYIGAYVYNKVWAYDWVYFRVGARYYLTDYIFLNLSLKAHGFKAQYIESGIGFSCRSWKNHKVKR